MFIDITENVFLMRVSGIQNYNIHKVCKNNSNTKELAFTSNENSSEFKGINGEVLKVLDENNLINIENISDSKVGSKFLVSFKDPKYSGLKILIKSGTKFASETKGIDLKLIKENQSFTGRVYGSIRKNDDGTCDEKMKKAYTDFWSLGMHQAITNKYIDKELTSRIKNDYNFFVPSDGDGTRYKDITRLQGGVTKPASLIPATLNGHTMSLVQVVLSNFTQTSKLDDGVGFIEVKPAQGSAYAFLEGLADGTISTEKPLVFSWGDNFSDINVTKLILDHEENNSGFTILSVLVDEKNIKSLGALKVNSSDDFTVTKFKEKPSDKDEIETYKLPELDNKYLASVGPFVISPEVLTWIKDKYKKNPESFKNPEGKGYDFSTMIIAPLLDALNNGEIKDKEGNPLSLRTKLLPKANTWSDLGTESDFSTNLNMVKNGSFADLPSEMKESISKNVDEYGNITFDVKTQKMLTDIKNEYGLNIENSICYYNFQ